jgi:hypothetical protein
MRLLFTVFILVIGFIHVNGQTWSTVGSGTNKPVFAMDTVGNYLYVGGAFDTAGGIALNHIAKWDGSTWSSLGGGINGDVYAITIYKGDIYAGGVFTTTASGPAANIAKWNGTAWLPLGSGTDGIVHTLAVWNGNLYAGGNFANAGGVAANNIASWNGSTWSPLGQGTDGTVNCMVCTNGKLYVGGVFSMAGGNPNKTLAEWNGNSWSTLNSPQGSSQTPPAVNAMTIFNGDLYYSLHTISSSFEYANITKYDGSAFSNEGSTSSSINGIAAFSSELYFGGALYQYPLIGKLTNTGCTVWGSSQAIKNYGAVNTLISFGNFLYAAGAFDSAGSIKASNIARWSFPGAGIYEVTNQHKLLLYPNPSTGLFTISATYFCTGAFLSIRNVLGELVKTIPLFQETSMVDLRDQKPGVYFYSLSMKNKELDFGKLVIN